MANYLLFPGLSSLGGRPGGTRPLPQSAPGLHRIIPCMDTGTKAVRGYDVLGHDMALYRRTPRRFGFRAAGPAGVRVWQARFRPALRKVLGLDLMEREYRGYRPRVRPAGTRDMGRYTRQEFLIWTEPDVPVPFWLLRPKGAKGRLPLVLTPHGHLPPHVYLGIARNAHERRLIRGSQDDTAVQAVREGYIALHPTVRGFGATREARDRRKNALSSCYNLEVRGLLVGRTAIGQRVWDIQRMLDWALRRDDVDRSRIAITGNSGGGTVSLFSGACDTRIGVVVPSCYFCTFAGSIGSIVHCPCNYIPGMLRLGEMSDVAGLVAPRPFRAIAGKTDDIYPVVETRKAFRALRCIYRAAGVPARCSLHVGSKGHRSYSAGSWPFIRRWFARVGGDARRGW